MKITFSRNQTTATAITMLLLLSMIASIALLPPVEGDVVTMHTSYIYCSVGSNVVGIGQQILLVQWTTDMPPDVGETDLLFPSFENRASWTGLSFNVTDPEGITTNILLGPSDPVGGGYYSYTPTKTGTYTIIAIFPDTWKNSTNPITAHQTGYPTVTQQHYTAAVSLPVTFMCQQETVNSWVESPLPNDYWTRPINNAARAWSALPGNWLGGAWQQPAGAAGGTTSRFVYGVGTETSHILWTRPQYVGGYMDARFNDTGYMTGHYQGLDFSAIIINGHIIAPARADSTMNQGFNVYNLYTGDLIGFYNETIPSYGQIYDYESPNQHGGYSYLWRSVTTGANTVWGTGNGTVLEMFDGYTLPLRHITFIANCSTTGTQVVGFTGEILYYNLVNKGTTDNPKYYLTCWNNTAIPTELLGTSGTNYWQWRPGSVAVHDGTQGFSLNVSITSVNGPRNSLLNETGTIRAVREGQYVIVGTAGRNDERGDVQGYLMAISLERGHEGQKLWDTTFSDPYADTASNASITLQSVYPDQGVFICGNTVTLGGSKYLKYWGYDLYTGKQIWVTDPEPQENYYSQQINVYQDKLITSGYGGVVIAYDLKTGKQVWNFTAINIGSESPYGNFPINIFAVCDGKLYTLTGEHSITQPMWRGPNIRCINATTGEEIWNLLGMGADNGAHLTGQYMQMGDGKVVGLNYFDNELYCIGPGPSATTVSAPQIIPTLGSSVMLTGTVTDQTATGRRNDNYNFDFTLQGTPAISDASMGRWMEYMYENQIMPKNATGDPVTLSAIDPNGNYIQIGQTTSDSHGNYGLTFTPQVPGTYQILASFAGSKAYSPSSATTYLSISDIAATPTPTITPQAQSVADLYFVPAIIGLFVFVAIIGAVIILMLRKRP